MGHKWDGYEATRSGRRAYSLPFSVPATASLLLRQSCAQYSFVIGAPSSTFAPVSSTTIQIDDTAHSPV